MNHRSTLLFIPLLLMISGEALAGTICWIEKVVTDKQGVRIFFISNMPLSGAVVAANKATPRRQFRIEEGKVHWIKDATEPSLLLKPGEWAPLIGGAENTCRISFDEELDQRGVTAEAGFTPPGQPMSATQFIPAESSSLSRGERASAMP